MKKIFGYAIVAVVSFAAGSAAGWFVRKKTSEVKFEVVDIQESKSEEGNTATEGGDAENHIDKLFEESVKFAVQEMDTQKEQYFKKWKADDAALKYDTRTKEDPKDPVVSEDLEDGLDPEFLNDIEEEDIGKNHPDIEEASIEDWNHWSGIPDGEYDCIEVYWFTGDNVLTDEDGAPLENPGKFMGFDVARKFNEIDEDTTGDPDIRIVYNHKEHAIFQIIRRSGSYARKRGMEEFGRDYRGMDDEEMGDE